MGKKDGKEESGRGSGDDGTKSGDNVEKKQKKSDRNFWVQALVVSLIVVVFAMLVAFLKVKQVPEHIAKKMAEDPELNRLMEKMKADENLRFAIDHFENFIRDLGQSYNPADFKDRPGLKLKGKRKAHMPIVVIPGITSSMLELWEGDVCAQAKFREKFWGTTESARQAFKDLNCWLRHLGLDEKTWRDPEGIKLRAVEGIGAMDYMMPGYFVWGKIFENLADVGYDPRLMRVFSYDWRLAPQDIEKEDGLFSRMKYEIEYLVRRNRERVAVFGHSMGSSMILYFINWITHKEGPEWLKMHVGAWVNIGGTLLGVTKASTVTISGESRDTVDFGRVIGQFTQGKFNVNLLRFFRSLGSVPSMLPKGNDAIWNHQKEDGVTFPMDIYERIESVFSKMNMTDELRTTRERLEKAVSKNYTAVETPELIRILAPEYMRKVDLFYRLDSDLVEDVSDPRTWTNPLAKGLPFIDPSTRIYCLYGYAPQVGTERGYRYSVNKKYIERMSTMPITLDLDAQEGDIKGGVQYGSIGDGTVPIMSLAYPCLGLWDGPTRHNPYGVRTITREYKHEPVKEIYEAIGAAFSEIPRGGPKAATHIELLGNHELINDIISIVTKSIKEGEPEEPVQQRIFSPIKEIVKKAQEDLKKSSYKD
mmetsp:Transcript_6764/g.20507  ORF Transcript_6764/g.20507 Transcript_6764/m.20507 type:complete len:648 (+) Transcript_6764:80-2023(+)